MEKKIPFTKSWYWKLLVFILIITLTPLLTFSFVIYYEGQNTLQRNVYADFEHVGAMQETTIRTWLLERSHYFSHLATLPEIRSMKVEQIAPVLRQGLIQYQNLDSLYVIGTNGMEVWDTDMDLGPHIQAVNLADRQYFVEAMRGRTYLSETVISKTTGNLILVIACPIFSDAGQIVGVMAGAMTSATINEVMQGVRIGQTGEAYLLNQNGLFLTPSRFVTELKQKGLVEQRAELEMRVVSEGARRALNGSRGVSEYDDYRGKRVVGAYRPLEVLNVKWAVLVEQNIEEAYASIFQLQTLILAFSLVAVLVVIGLSMILGSMMTRPIIQIREAALRLARGDVYQEIPIRSEDEIGSMAEAFRQMIAYLKYIADASVSLSRGDLTVQVVPQSEQDILGNSFRKMIADLRDLVHEDSLLILERKFNHLYRSALDGMVYLDVSGRVVDCNLAFEQMVGTTKEDLRGKKIPELLPRTMLNEGPFSSPERMFEKGVSALYERELFCKDGRSLPVEIVSYLVQGEDGRSLGIWAFVRDLTERKKAESDLRASEDRYRRLFEGASLGIFQTSIDGHILQMNQAMCRILGIKSPQEAIEKYPDVSAFYANPVQRQNMVALLLDGEDPLSMEVRLLRPTTQQEVDCWLSVRTVHGAKGEIVYLEGFLEDISDRKRTERELRQYREHLEDLVKQRTGELEQLNRSLLGEINQRKQVEVQLIKAKEAAEIANQAKSSFLAKMSHELRTPLNAILGFSRLLLQSGNLDTTQQKNVEIVVRSGEHLLDLINDILDLSKIESGKITLNNREFNLMRMVESLEEMFSLKAHEKMLTFIVDRVADLPRYVNGDEGKLRQVLINLLGNAVKFTSEGFIALRLGAEFQVLEGQTRAWLTFSVEDSGPGIATQEQAQIFDAFVQASGMTSGEGTGLGLAISRQFVQLMGGNLTVTSYPGKGSTFRFTIPLDVVVGANMREGEKRRVIGIEAGQPECRILIVDDRQESRMLLKHILDLPVHGEGSNCLLVQEAANGLEALRVWEEWQPHLIWMDMRMPVMDGYETTRRIKSSEQGRETVIIALTASAFEEDRALILAGGCDDFVRKPYLEHEIFDRLVHFLSVRFVYEAPPSEQPQEKTADIDTEALNESIRQLPSEVAQSILEAARAFNARQIRMESLKLKDLGLTHLAVVLVRLANNYDYEGVIRLLEPPAEGIVTQPEE